MAEPATTRQRLLAAGMRLFADRGFRATAVGDIETAVGLQPRRGALYKHFPSKQALLEAAVRTYLDTAAAGAAQIGDLNVGALGTDPTVLRTIVTGLGRWFLDEMDRLKDLTRVLEHDGARMRQIVVDVKTDIVDLSYRTATTFIAAVAPEANDPEATAVILLGALVALRRTAWTFGTSPLELDDERALTAWTQLTLTALNAPRNAGHH